MSIDRPTGGITRRQVLQAGVAAAGMALAPKAAFTMTTDKPRQPNILFLMTDQHRGDCVGADGNKVVRTPHLDRLATGGVHFRRAYSSMPSCTPARTALLTGQSPWSHGMLTMTRMAADYPVAKPRLMRQAGYYTAGIGKMHFYPQRNGYGYDTMILDESSRAETEDFVSDYHAWLKKIDPSIDPDITGVGWNDYHAKPYALDEKYHPTAWTGDTAVEFISKYDKPQPLFLKVSFARPHSPYDPPQRFFDMYKDADLPAAHIGAWAEAMYGQPGNPKGTAPWHGNYGKEQVRLSRQGYYGSISFIDEQIGRILDAMDKRGLLDNTLILMTSDHGDMTGDHHLWRKTYAYEASARVPMILWWGRDVKLDAQRGQSLSQTVEMRDVLPTFLDAAGAAVPKSVEGKSVLELARGNTKGWREWIDLEHGKCYDASIVWTALTDGHVKYIYFGFTGKQQFFDLDKDPGETNDLSASAEHADAVALWRKRMVEHLAVRGEPWVVNGDLGIRTQPILHGPNFPKDAS